jgi:hypothetical protein
MSNKISVASFCLLFSVWLFAGCYTGKRAEVKRIIAASEVLLPADAARMNGLQGSKNLAFELEKIDTTVASRINSRLQVFLVEMDSVREGIGYLKDKLKNKKAFRRAFNEYVLPRLLVLKKYNETTYLRVYQMQMTDEAIRIADKKLYQLAAFFGPGKYRIPEEKYDIASTGFIPLCDSLVRFSNKYDSLPSTATLVVNGFADGAGYDETAEIFQTLLNYLKKENPSKKELNTALSALRANQISQLLETLLKARSMQISDPDKTKFFFYGFGQGETYPSKKITDYTEDDERRRVVLIYWIVLPD